MSESHAPLSIRESLQGRHVLLTGGSGFVGKVWLSMALTQLPELERIYVFLRPKALVPARQRFEKMLNTSPAFRPLHERFGPRLAAYLADRVEVLEGELSEPDLGLAPSIARFDCVTIIDVFIHCAGLVDFNPDLRKVAQRRTRRCDRARCGLRRGLRSRELAAHLDLLRRGSALRRDRGVGPTRLRSGAQRLLRRDRAERRARAHRQHRARPRRRGTPHAPARKEVLGELSAARPARMPARI